MTIRQLHKSPNSRRVTVEAVIGMKNTDTLDMQQWAKAPCDARNDSIMIDWPGV